MLLRTLWDKLGAARNFVTSAFPFHPTQAPKCEIKFRTHPRSSALQTTRSFNAPLFKPEPPSHFWSPALSGSQRPGCICSMDFQRRSNQKRWYASNLVKSVLKPTLKPVIAPGKRVPKGPRTKQPSRANQPSLNQDTVSQSALHDFVLSARVCVSVLVCLLTQDMMQCIAFATADQYNLPTLSVDLTRHGFHEVEFPRGKTAPWGACIQTVTPPPPQKKP